MLSAPPLCDHVEQHQLYHRNLLARMRDPAVSELYDIRVHVAGECFLAHKPLLCAVSDVFRCMLLSHQNNCSHDSLHAWAEAGAQDIHISFIHPSAFASLLDFIYTGKLASPSHIVLELYSCARLLLLDNPLEDIVRSRLMLHISAATVLDVAAVAYLFDDTTVLDACENFIEEHFVSVANTPAFLELNLEALTYFLTSERLFLASGEVDLLDAVLKWVRHRPMQRISSFSSLLASLQISDIAESQLQDSLKLIPKESPIFHCVVHNIENVFNNQNAPSIPGHHHRTSSETGDPESRPLLVEPRMTMVLSPANESPQFRSQRRWRRCTAEVDASEGPKFRVGRKCVRSIRFDMVVPNFSKYSRGAEPVNSHWHKCGSGLMWRLEVYPRGPSLDQDEYMSVFLRCCEETSTEAFSNLVNFALFIIDQNFGGQASCFSATKTFTHQDACWGKVKFVKLSDIMSAENTLRDVTTDSVVVAASVMW